MLLSLCQKLQCTGWEFDDSAPSSCFGIADIVAAACFGMQCSANRESSFLFVEVRPHEAAEFATSQACGDLQIEEVMPNSGYHRMKKLLAEAGLPNMRFHDLRHTFATHALTSGVDVKTLSGILGHTKTAFTLDTYTHVTGDMHRKASEIVGGFMEDFIVRG